MKQDKVVLFTAIGAIILAVVYALFDLIALPLRVNVDYGLLPPVLAFGASTVCQIREYLLEQQLPAGRRAYTRAKAWRVTLSALAAASTLMFAVVDLTNRP